MPEGWIECGLVLRGLSYTRRYSKNETCFYNENGITAQPLANKYTDQEIRLSIGLHIRRYKFIGTINLVYKRVFCYGRRGG